ncbi:NAD-dependent epimerase/dehydratase family protein [Flavobacteriaceae bacterium]|nr:NAD-dependent epimerase/dehydratase family protein [Flavobacteriaceae bacterium]
MKILVTGGAGFIGANLCEKLIKSHEVYSIDNYSIGSLENHINGVIYINGDIAEISNILENDFDLCFHLAGLSRIQPSFNNPFNTFHSNTLGTQKVLDWSRKNSTKIIYSGSSSKHHNPYQSPYALYKYLGEELCKMYKEVYGMKIEIARFYNVYGPKEIIDGDWAAVIGIWRRQIRDGEALTIVGDGEQRRDFTHVHDIVDGLIKISETDKSHIDAWELGSGKNYSINEISKMFSEKFNCKIEYVPNQNGNYRETLREHNDAIELLGWRPKMNINSYINSL